VSRVAGCSNIDHFFRTGSISDAGRVKELGAYFLRVAMGFEEDEFIPFVGNQEAPNFVPQSEDYYPWAFFCVPTSQEDLMEVFHRKAMQYLHSDVAGKKNYTIITNFRSVIVCDLKHYLSDYDLAFADLYDAINNQSATREARKAIQTWSALLEDFGPASSTEKKKQRRSNVIQYVEPRETHLDFVRRFGHMPSFEKPIGWDGKEFRLTFKTKDLPFLTSEEFDWHDATTRCENRLIWGDNLAVMRTLPSESIDLIYIDPPFFSGRTYNCIFGDNDEVRTFNDIWDGGLPTYLAWLNARLWELRRLLKSTGSLYVHLDWHAVHYVKVELDKIFGYENFRNEIVWYYPHIGNTRKDFARKHDSILRYTKTKDFVFNLDDVREEYDEKTIRRYQNKVVFPGGYEARLNERGKIPTDVWQIPPVRNVSSEKIGYPTQKPEKLLERIILASSKPGDIVADFFSGGGTTIAVAEKLGRRWIGCDVSRIAVSVACDRMQKVYSVDAGVAALTQKPQYGFKVENQGAYDKATVRQLSIAHYRNFILQCFEAQTSSKSELIHGVKGERGVYIASPKGKLSVGEIEEFHIELSQNKFNAGFMLAWSWDKEAEAYIDELRSGKHGIGIQLIQVKLVDIDSHEFTGDNIRFLNKPIADIRYKHAGGLRWVFDGTASTGRNETDIHYYQWDFNYNGRFSPMTKPNFSKDKDGDGNPLNDNRKVEFEFPQHGTYRVALRIIDRSGAEDIHVINFDTKTARKEAA
jgi:adenine-specific DNA-methyltransferase